MKPRRPISGISDILTRECPITDDTPSQDDFGTVNDRDDDTIKNNEWFENVNVELPVVEDVDEEQITEDMQFENEAVSDSDGFNDEREDEESHFTVSRADSLFTKEDLELYKKQIEQAIAAELEKKSISRVSASGLDSTFKRDSDSQFEKLGDSYNMTIE